MKYSFLSDKDWQIKYYINLATDINAGVFTNNKLVLLPYKSGDWWYFPDIGLFDFPDIHSILDNLNQEQGRHKNYFYIHNEDIYNYVKQNLSGSVFPKQAELDIDLKDFSLVIGQIDKYIDLLFEGKLEISEILVVPSMFGTGRTYSTFLENGETKLICVYKLGNLNSMVESIFSGIINCVTGFAESNWDESDLQLWKYREIICNFFRKNTSLSNFGKSLPTAFDVIETNDTQKLIHSAEYFKKMGLNIRGRIESRNNDIYYDEVIVHGLSKSEVDLLRFFMNNRLQVITFDDIAKILWKDEWREKFSLEAIAKSISRIRIKFNSLDAPKNLIITVRGVGYVLND